MTKEIKVGDTFHRWTVVEVGLRKTYKGHNFRCCRCICSCSKHTNRIILETNLLQGKTKSCGCLTRDNPINNPEIGDKMYGRNGYVWVYQPDHPTCFKAKSNKGWIQEHRYVMEKHIGRILRRDETIHHINRKRDDNRLENLLLVSRSEHAKIHAFLDGRLGVHKTCKVCGKDLNVTIGSKRKREYCQDCWKKIFSSRHKSYPSIEELCTLCEKFGYEEVGRMYGVSGNAIKKKIKNSGHPIPITKYTNHKERFISPTML